MNFNSLFDKIEMPKLAEDNFYTLHKRASQKRFSDSVRLAHILFMQSDDAFAPFLKSFAAEEKVLPEVMNFYLYLRFSENLKKEYERRGYGESIFYDSILDLASSGRRLYERTGIFGISQPAGRLWFRRLFSLSIFRFGRLAFELIPAPCDAEVYGEKICKGELCVTTHIPAFSKLDERLCEESYSAVREFLRKHFGIKKPIIFCTSWLIHPFLSEVLGEESGIVKFQRKFKLLSYHYDSEAVIYRVFPAVCDNIDDYPENTTLQKIVKQRLLDNMPIGVGVGVRL